MRRFVTVMLGLGLAMGAAAWWLSAPRPLPDTALAGLTGDAVAGARVFHAAGCAGCHSAPGARATDGPPVLAGGHLFQTPFGTIPAPNISPDPDHGIGGWSRAEFASALQRGVSPEGRHYYPAFPYTAYSLMAPQDIADLWAYMQGLPRSQAVSLPAQMAFPYNLRRGLGLWKLRYMPDGFVGAAPSAQLERGRYLAEALGHCAECHTPRDRFGGLDRSRWMAGAPLLTGKGRVPNITPAALDWSARDIAWYLESGFTPDYDSAGGAMAEVVENLSKLPAEDRSAIAAYLKGLAPLD